MCCDEAVSWKSVGQATCGFGPMDFKGARVPLARLQFRKCLNENIFGFKKTPQILSVLRQTLVLDMDMK